MKFSNRTDVGICFSYSAALASMIAFPTFFFFRLWSAYPGRASPGAHQQNPEEQRQLRAAGDEFLGTGEQGGNEARTENILKELSDLCLRSWACWVNSSLEPEIKNCSQHSSSLSSTAQILEFWGSCSVSVLELAAHTNFWSCTIVYASTWSSL